MKTEHHFALAIHGGTGAILRENMTSAQEAAYREILETALRTGEAILRAKGSAVDAVDAAVQVMEDSDLFNAGKGSVFNHDGVQEMDAAIMDGSDLSAGAVAGVGRLRNPIAAARKVMENSEHVMLIGQGAERFAAQQGCELESLEYFFSQHRYDQLQDAIKADLVSLDHSEPAQKASKKLGTVGAVAMDVFGNLAAATSTGGMTNKKHGRLGDTPIIGAGTYANNQTCAVSCTGHGEHFIRNVVAYDISALMEYRQLSIKEASQYVISEKLGKQGMEGGLIAVDAKGNVSLVFNTPGMYRGSVSSESIARVDIYAD